MLKILGLLSLALSFGSANAVGASDWDIIIGDGAPENVVFEDVIVNGDGCPNAEQLISKDKMSVSILFSDFFIEKSPSRSRRPERLNCQMSMNIKVPAGYSIAVYQMEYRGYLYLPAGAKAQISSEYFYAGIPGMPFKTAWDSTKRSGRKGVIKQDGEKVATYNKKDDGVGYEDEFMLRTRRIAETSNFSKCSADVQLRNQTTMKVYTHDVKKLGSSEDTFLAIDSVDTTVNTPYGYKFFFAFKKCK